MTRPLRILELRSARGTGGGPEKTILLGTAQTDASRFAITVCYIRDVRDGEYAVDARAKKAGVDYVEIRERHSFDVRIWKQLRALVRERSIDIVHAHDYKTDALALLLGRAERIIPLATAHGWTGNSLRERLLYYPVDRRLLARFPRVAAVSHDIRDALVRAGARPDRLVTILNGINHRLYRHDPSRVRAARAKLGISDGTIAIGAIGRLERQKRFDVLLDAFACAHQRCSKLQLLIAGEGSQRPLLEQQAFALGLGEACRLLGHCSDIETIHHAVDLFVQSSDYEGTPNAVLEAMAFETPIIATDAGGTRDLITDGTHGIVVAPGDVTAIAAAIDSALRDRSATARRVAEARRRVECELSFDARMSAIESLYADLAAAYGRAN